MDQFKRFAVYFAPRPGPFALRAAQWLGTDAETGAEVAQPEIADLSRPLAEITAAPRRYGFHGTLRAPFRPAEGHSLARIRAEVQALAAALAPAGGDSLTLLNLHGFFALVPRGDLSALNQLAAEVVRATNHLRAPLTEAEIARRHPETLTRRQRGYLADWGYPHVMDDFTFHLTLTDRLSDPEARQLLAPAKAHFSGCLPEPFVIEDLCLFGEGPTGQFRLLDRFPLQG